MIDRHKQRGMGFIGIFLILVLGVLIAVGGMKIAPAYMEYFTIKKALAGMVESGELRNATVGDVRRAFQRRADIDDITAIGANDLEVTKEGGEIVISFAYEKRVKLFHNVSMLFEFEGSTGGSSRPRGE